MKEIPLIKEYRIDKLRDSLDCINRFAYHRDKQRDCILKLYSGNDKMQEYKEKSIFRGMVIPSLRYLGLIIGFGDMIRPSANGKLIVESQSDGKLYRRVWRSIIYEIDKDIFHFIPSLIKKRYSKNDFISFMSSQIYGVNIRQKKERIKKWLIILDQVELIKYFDVISLHIKNYNQVLLDTNPLLKDFGKFREYIIEGYFSLAKLSAGIVDIRELREFVCTRFLKEDHSILTEKQFDVLLREFISKTSEFHVSLGEPMGSDQKLFEYKQNFYKTIIMRRVKGA